MENVGIKVQVDTGSIGDLRKQLKDATKDLQLMQQQFGEFSDEAVAAAKRVAGLRDAIGDANSLVDAFNPDKKFAAFGQALSGVAGGFAAVQGAMGLFGTESKELEAQLLKVQSAMALSQGLDSVMDSIQGFKNLGSVIKSQVVGAFNVLKGAIGATGIGLLVVAVGMLAANWAEVKKWITNTFPALNNVSGLFDKVKQVAMGVGNVLLKYIVMPLKAIGKAIQGDFSGALDEIKKGYDVVGNFRAGAEKEQTRQEAAAADERLENQIKAKEKKIRLLQAEGKETYALEVEVSKSKQQLLKGDNEKLAEEQEKEQLLHAAHRRKLREENQKSAKEREEEEKKAREAEKERELRLQQSISDGLYKAREGAKNLEKKINEDRIKDAKATEESIAELAKQGSEQAVAELNRRATMIKEVEGISFQERFSLLDSQKQMILSDARLTEEERTRLLRENSEARLKVEEAEGEARVLLAQKITGLLDAFAGLAGEQTAFGKTLAIASATINTYLGASQALKADYGMFGPAAQVARFASVAAVIATGLKLVKSIVAVKVPGATGSSGSPNMGGLNPNISAGGGAPLSPQLQINSTALSPDTMNQLGNAVFKAYVVESDVTGTQQRIRRLQSSASFD